MECCGRPNRSDVHLSREEEAKIEGRTRDYFDGLAPKRHTKPQRSDYSSSYVDSNSDDHGRIPELEEFQRLESENDPQLVYSNSKAEEEFVETEYYKGLNCIDKHHHKTGTGFISVEEGKDNCFHLAPDASSDFHHVSCKGNPATNDWIPATSDGVTFASDKPNRSEN
ncbi:hypothetical protein MLD38_008382 [Melastoma candidum]|uniref:Uncharacterized protein n=1 Tax=Melastoma candidum TaxID=119954 RepID=A0ACB9RVE3_9MYRT|nr:hypothetical protein MLD38_008382 [Melastoma candidum]